MDRKPKRPGGSTILLAEDETSVRRLACAILKAEGHRLLEATDGEEALGLADAYPGPIDLLLTDVMMPAMNGRELADRLCLLRPDIKVLFMSGYPGDFLSTKGVCEDAVDFLAKPFSPRALAQKVRAILDLPPVTKGRG